MKTVITKTPYKFDEIPNKTFGIEVECHSVSTHSQVVGRLEELREIGIEHYKDIPFEIFRIAIGDRTDVFIIQSDKDATAESLALDSLENTH